MVTSSYAHLLAANNWTPIRDIGDSMYEFDIFCWSVSSLPLCNEGIFAANLPHLDGRGTGDELFLRLARLAAQQENTISFSPSLSPEPLPTLLTLINNLVQPPAFGGQVQVRTRQSQYHY